MPADVLAGLRDIINQDPQRDTVAWPDRGNGAGVKLGQVIKLRTCHIEVKRLERRREDGIPVWRMWFRRHYPEGRVYLLTPSSRAGDDGRGYTSNDELAARGEDPNQAATLASLDPLANPANLAGPPEPEAVPPHEIGTYTGDALARRRFEHENQRARMLLASQPLEVRLATVRLTAAHNHIDISSDVRVIERRVQALERKVSNAA